MASIPGEKERERERERERRGEERRGKENESIIKLNIESPLPPLHHLTHWHVVHVLGMIVGCDLSGLQ